MLLAALHRATPDYIRIIEILKGGGGLNFITVSSWLAFSVSSWPTWVLHSAAIDLKSQQISPLLRLHPFSLYRAISFCTQVDILPWNICNSNEMPLEFFNSSSSIWFDRFQVELAVMSVRIDRSLLFSTACLVIFGISFGSIRLTVHKSPPSRPPCWYWRMKMFIHSPLGSLRRHIFRLPLCKYRYTDYRCFSLPWKPAAMRTTKLYF